MSVIFRTMSLQCTRFHLAKQPLYPRQATAIPSFAPSQLYMVSRFSNGEGRVGSHAAYFGTFKEMGLVL